MGKDTQSLALQLAQDALYGVINSIRLQILVNLPSHETLASVFQLSEHYVHFISRTNSSSGLVDFYISYKQD